MRHYRTRRKLWGVAMFEKVFYSGSSEESIPDLSEDFCNAIIKVVDNVEEQKATVHGRDNSQDVRNNSVYAVDDSDFKKVVLSWMLKANVEMGWEFDITGIETLQLSKYSENQKYSWHYDVMPGPTARKLTFTVSLNTEYKGGEFQFSWGKPNWKYKQRTLPDPALETVGKFIIFPSYYYHRVLPVTEGVRYSLTGWAYGPPFK